LLDRDEDPHHIRLLDLRPPPSKALKGALQKGVQFVQVDISDAPAVLKAFSAPWPSSVRRDTEITVYHTAASIRFYERFRWQLPASSRVNVDGTRNVIEAATHIGANILVYTSSGSVGIRSNRWLLWPWESAPKYFVQIIHDRDQEREKDRRHEDYFSNYAVSKAMGEKLVRSANGRVINSNGKVLRTGCIRPGNGVFGPRGDMLVGAYIARKTNPTWISEFISSHSYVENTALAHLLYEQRLIALSAPSPPKSLPDISGQAFNICDPGPTPTNGDVFTTLTTLTSGECHFTLLSPTFMHLLAHIVEFYYTLPSFFFTVLRFPRIKGNIINLQPALYNLTQVHLIFDDSRARLSPEEGGLGYSGAWTTLEGAHKTVKEHYKNLDGESVRADQAGLNFDLKFGLGWGKAKTKVPQKREVVEASNKKKTVNSIVPVEVNSLQ
jgi:nucleoside-diphosphate-sugar epimerase